MLYAQANGLLANIMAATTTWKMSFQTVHFLLFLPLAMGIYYMLPKTLRRGWLLLASYYFYFFAAPQYLPVLLFGTIFTYCMGRLVASFKTPSGKKNTLFVAILGCVLGLSFFKYNGFFSLFMAPLFQALGLAYDTNWFTTIAAVGISYYTFTSIGYLIDVYRGDVPVQKNILTYSLFLSFFPSVVAGPIARAGTLMPQLEDMSKKFDAQNAADALRLMAIGFFKKLAVADTIGLFVVTIYKESAAYTGLTLTMAAIGFALQLYFDFSGYSDIALACAQLLGIKLQPNFNTPYFATNFSGFWARWHMSLSGWLQDYIFTPLVWSRWPEKLPLIGKWMKKPPVLSSIAIVFMFSGIWHGDTFNFVVWGALQAVFRIGEELLHRFMGKPKKKLPLLARIGKTTLVLVLWTESLVFFAAGLITKISVGEAASLLLRQFSGISLRQTALDIYGSITIFPNKPFIFLFFAFTLVCGTLAVWADWVQCFKLKGASLVSGIKRLRTPLRWVVYFILIFACFAGFLLQNGGFGDASFLYGGV